MSAITPLQKHLPELPIPPLPIHGRNLDHGTLMIREPGSTAEKIVAEYIAAHGPENCAHFRRYYVEPVVMGGRGTGRYRLKYVWNTDEPGTDVTVGILGAEDPAEARILIGNQVARACMPSIAWHLCEDREGENVVEIGRFDPWSLLKDLTPDDLERIKRRGRVPLVEHWDFDLMFLARTCQGCGCEVVVNMFAYSIDSARCINCGTRPFLSKALNRIFSGFVSVTGKGGLDTDQEINAQLVLHAVGWMGQVHAPVRDLRLDSLPPTITPKQLFRKLLTEAQLLPKPGKRADDGDQSLIKVEQFDDSLVLTAGTSYDRILMAIDGDEPLSSLHAKAADFLRELIRQS